jgi:hypothetical protein
MESLKKTEAKEGGPPMEGKKPYRKRLKTLEDVRIYLARLINEARMGEVEPSLAGKLGFLLNILRGVIVDSDLEARVGKLEKELEK